MNRLLDKHRQTLILVLSALILAGSGISLGFGISELGRVPTPLQTSGFVSGSENEQMNRLTDEPITGPININTASAIELEALPGIGATKAAAIVSYREKNGPFRSITEIQNVSGIGPKTFDQLKDLITVSK